MIGKQAFGFGFTVLALMSVAGEGAANGASDPAPTVEVIEGVPNPTLLAVGDLNGDGKLDLAVVEHTIPKAGSPEKGRVCLHLLYEKSDRFSMPPDKTIELPTAPSGLLIGDFDGDGTNDLAVGLRSKRTMAIYPGSGRFENAHRLAYNNDSGGASLSAGRINPSGLADFMTGAAWRKWMGGDRFAAGYFCGPERNDNYRSTLADLDWDGRDDVLFTTFGSDTPPPACRSQSVESTTCPIAVPSCKCRTFVISSPS